MIELDQNIINCHVFTLFYAYMMGIWGKNWKFFIFIFFCFLSFFGILAICHIWLPDMRKQLIFWPKWLLAVPLGPTGSQYSKKSKVITLRLCRIHTYDFCFSTYLPPFLLLLTTSQKILLLLTTSWIFYKNH